MVKKEGRVIYVKNLIGIVRSISVMIVEISVVDVKLILQVVLVMKNMKDAVVVNI
tara:strand:+ start:77 stop:241 length:165 start_codon:yes stop_codon:yes gene_type:complete